MRPQREKIRRGDDNDALITTQRQQMAAVAGNDVSRAARLRSGGSCLTKSMISSSVNLSVGIIITSVPDILPSP